MRSSGRPWFFNLATPRVFNVFSRVAETASLSSEVPLSKDKSIASDIMFVVGSEMRCYGKEI
jgi:hypothetical protein